MIHLKTILPISALLFLSIYFADAENLSWDSASMGYVETKSFDDNGYVTLDRAYPNASAPGYYVDAPRDETVFTVEGHDISLQRIVVPKTLLMSGDKPGVNSPMTVPVFIYENGNPIATDISGYMELRWNYENTRAFDREILLKANHTYKILLLFSEYNRYAFDGSFRTIRKCVINGDQAEDTVTINFENKESPEDKFGRRTGVGAVQSLILRRSK